MSLRHAYASSVIKRLAPAGPDDFAELWARESHGIISMILPEMLRLRCRDVMLQATRSTTYIEAELAAQSPHGARHRGDVKIAEDGDAAGRRHAQNAGSLRPFPGHALTLSLISRHSPSAA